MTVSKLVDSGQGIADWNRCPKTSARGGIRASASRRGSATAARLSTQGGLCPNEAQQAETTYG